MSLNAIPLFDLSTFLHGSLEERESWCHSLLQACAKHGFLRLKNHGIQQQKIDDLFGWSRNFFAMPNASKAKAAHPVRPFPHRGWSHVGQERLSGITDYQKGEESPAVCEDTKESFDQGSTTDAMYQNVWPDEADLPGFQVFMEDIYDEFQKIHVTLLNSLEIGLGLKQNRLSDLCSRNETELRLTHYPAVDLAKLLDGSRTRIAAHTDFGTLTLLLQDSTGGLQVEMPDKENTFLPLDSATSDEMIVNVGDTLQNWTNEVLRSTNHRVTIPASQPKDAGGQLAPRYSVAFFGKANRDVSLRCLSEFLALKPPKMAEDITTWDYNSKMVNRTYPHQSIIAPTAV